jgi:hypothetical protein
MAVVEIPYCNICPYLVEEQIQVSPIEVNLKTFDIGANSCEVGEQQLNVEVLEDMMLNPKTVNIYIGCKCPFVPKGFSKLVAVPNPDHHTESPGEVDK